MFRFTFVLLLIVCLFFMPFPAHASTVTTLWHSNLPANSLGLHRTFDIRYHVLVFNDSGTSQDYTFRLYFGSVLVSTLSLRDVPDSLTDYNPLTMQASMHSAGDYYNQNVVVVWAWNNKPVQTDILTTHLNTLTTQSLLLTEQYSWS